MIDFQIEHRSAQSEIMDDLELHGPELGQLLNDLARVNRFLGGYRSVTNAVGKLIKNVDQDCTLVIADLGCGDGALLRRLSDWANIKGWKIKGIGMDANPYILDLARSRSSTYDNLSFIQLDVFDKDSQWPEMDISLCSLFLHHFTNNDITIILNRLLTLSRSGVIVSDLERNKMALRLFKLIAPVFLRSPIARHDGQVSIARGFTKEELKQLSKQISGQHSLEKKWAYRWQWIINTKKD